MEIKGFGENGLDSQVSFPLGQNVMYSFYWKESGYYLLLKMDQETCVLGIF